MVISKSSLLILCGQVEYSLEQFNSIVTWCPIRRAVLRKKGIGTYLFGDFSPEEERGRDLDLEFHKNFEICLHEEAKNTPSLKWAPLIIQHLKLRLSRYLWLKECLRAMIRKLRPSRIILSSGNDVDMVWAVKAVGEECNIQVEIRHGECDASTTSLYLLASYALSSSVDPFWFHKSRWYLRTLLRKDKKELLELYPNFPKAFIPKSAFSFTVRRGVSLLFAFAQKFSKLSGIKTAVKSVDLNSKFDEAAPFLLNEKIWMPFSKDEKSVINALLVRYFSHYPAEIFDKIESRLEFIFSTLKPSRIVLTLDHVDVDRLATYVAKRCGIQVDYLPHGIVWEDYSGPNHNLSFQYDRMLAWNESSRKAFEGLGWVSQCVRHPQFQKTPQPMRQPSTEYAKWRVLVFVPEWWGVSIVGREDCAVVDFIEIYHGLQAMGILGSHVHASFHTSPIEAVMSAKYQAFQRLKDELKMDFEIHVSASYSSERFSGYDLAVIGATTGILEAVFSGIPIISFGMGIDRLGVLKGIDLPHARTGEELVDCIKRYDGERMRAAYKQLAESLQSGVELGEINT